MVCSFTQLGLARRTVSYQLVTSRIAAVLRISFCMSINKYLLSFIVENASRSSQLSIFRSLQAILKQRVLSTCILSRISISRMSRTNQTSQSSLSPMKSYCQSTRFHQASIPDTFIPSVSMMILNWC
jgi:hypothetical protein